MDQGNVAQGQYDLYVKHDTALLSAGGYDESRFDKKGLCSRVGRHFDEEEHWC